MSSNYSLLHIPECRTYSAQRYKWSIIFMLALLIVMQQAPVRASSGNGVMRYAAKSGLAEGTWVRISVTEAGIYRLTYQDLVNMQLPVSGILSSSLKIHGYGGMLPEIAGEERYDDLPEIAITVVDGGDNRFDPGDYLLFYSPGPDEWKYHIPDSVWIYKENIYSDYTYYFVRISDEAGKRIANAGQPGSANTVINFYNYRAVVNPELYNLIKSGRGWYGDLFDIVTSRDYAFPEASLKPKTDINIRFSAVARSFKGSNFKLMLNGVEHYLPIQPVQSDYTTNFAYIATTRFIQQAPQAFNTLKVVYNKSAGADNGWLNFVEINAVALLRYNNEQYFFRNNVLRGNVEYSVSDVPAGIMVWDITDPQSPQFVKGALQGNTYLFKAYADTIREYVMFDPGKAKSPSFVEKVSNQNLHGMPTPDMLIIAPDIFINEAYRLATFHANHDGLSVSVVTPQAIYNEFSSGAQDISAIRDFIKMLWHKAEPANKPRYVLLFGDASFDYKDRLADNTNFVPTYQSPESLHPVTSLATDDFFVSIDDREGGNSNDIIDIGIGRLPVISEKQATMAVDKIIHYTTARELVNGDWRNVIAFVADDEDGNVHMAQADSLARIINSLWPQYNTDKIFLDAFVQETLAGGQRSPEANAAINERVNKGALLINYTGHGGETGWTKEEILQVKDINGWRNYNRLPVFMTATCEFSRYDDPTRVSGGEYAFLNDKGGAIALFTTARPTFGTPNFTLAKNFYETALQPMNGRMPRLGDIIRLSKQRSSATDNTKKFVLLGDPAMTMAYPEYKVISTGVPDTIRALDKVTITGMVTDEDGNKLNNFNGTVIPTVYDKASEITTYGSEGNTAMSFFLRRNIIYKGKAEVKNGDFSFTFIVPRDIAYQYGTGKISYYATDGVSDASGQDSDMIVGGFTDNAITDFEGPLVDLFINDSSFVNGGITDENPVLLAYVADESGINTIGNGIGHDITAILDGDTQNPMILNDYYQAEVNSFSRGIIRYPVFGLDPGPHTLTLKLFDVYNNSSETTLNFIVAGGSDIILSELAAWPNPVRDFVNFTIEHNQAGTEMQVTFNLYDVSGKKIIEKENTILPEGYRTLIYNWDGTADGIKRVTSGFYIANIKIQTSTGLSDSRSVKVIIAR